MLRLLGLEICSSTLVGNEMLRGISGGQKKRVTAGGDTQPSSVEIWATGRAHCRVCLSKCVSTCHEGKERIKTCSSSSWSYIKR